MIGWFFLVTAVSAAPPVPVALAAEVKGAVTLRRGDMQRPLEAADLLLPGDRLTAEGGAGATLVFLADGRRERLKGMDPATVGEKGCEPPSAVEAVEGAARPSAAVLGSLRLHARSVQAGGGRAAVGVLRSDPAEKPAPVTPMYGARVATDHPTLAWPAVPGARGYVVEMCTGEQGSAERVLWRAAVAEPRLPYPEDEKVLDEGLKRWRVRARVGDHEDVVAQGKFFVLGEAQATELAKLRPLAAGDDPAEWLLAAAAYEARGVYDRALPLYEKLAEHDTRSANYQVALARYYERAGRKDRAAAAWERAKKLGVKVPAD